MIKIQSYNEFERDKRYNAMSMGDGINSGKIYTNNGKASGSGYIINVMSCLLGVRTALHVGRGIRTLDVNKVYP